MAKWTEPGDVLDVSGVQQSVDHVEHEQRLHPVVGKAFPSFGEGDVGKPARMADEAAILRVVHRGRVLCSVCFDKHRRRTISQTVRRKFFSCMTQLLVVNS